MGLVGKLGHKWNMQFRIICYAQNAIAKPLGFLNRIVFSDSWSNLHNVRNDGSLYLFFFSSPYAPQLLAEVIHQERKRLVKTKSRFPVLTLERLRDLMATSKLRIEKAELDQVGNDIHIPPSTPIKVSIICGVE